MKYFLRLLFLVINLSTSFAANSAIVNTLGLGGAKDVWDSNEKKSLTYCIDSLGMSFDEYFYMEAAMSSATQEWELFTDIDFIHKPAYDTQCNNTNLNVMFNVRKNNNWNQEARAFFPGDSRLLREIIIGSGFLNFNLATFPVSLYGVVRHELGHVLGLRHEHIRADFPGGPKCTESNNYQILTPPDFYSVMNYAPCVRQQWFELSLSAWDINGIKQLYDDVPLPLNQGAQPPTTTDLRWLPAVINFILLD